MQELFIVKIGRVVILRGEHVDTAAAQLLRDSGMHLRIHIKRNGHEATI